MATAARENLTIESRERFTKVLESTNKRRKERRETWESYVQPTKRCLCRHYCGYDYEDLWFT